MFFMPSFPALFVIDLLYHGEILATLSDMLATSDIITSNLYLAQGLSVEPVFISYLT